jgi:flagellar biosynthetic protein FlhB
MADGGDGAERSHEPTPRRREEARREGRILTSKDAAVFGTFAAAVLALQGLAALAPAAAPRWAAALRGAASAGFETAAVRALADAAWAVLAAGLGVAVPAALAAVAVQAAAGGLHWIPRNLALRGDRLDPLAGLGRIVSSRALVELGKALVKVVLMGAVVAAFAAAALPRLPALQDMPGTAAAAALAGLIFRLFWMLALVLAAAAAIDLLWQLRQHGRSLRMTLDEVRRESREDNGAPELKARQRRLQAEAARRGSRERAALAEVPKATAIITNPRHFAVALRYAAGETAAPVIVARGTDAIAAQIVALGRGAGVPVLPLPPLARALYFTGEIGRPIPEGLFAAVAAVLAHLWRVERGMRDTLDTVELPPGMRFDARGRRDGTGLADGG